MRCYCCDYDTLLGSDYASIPPTKRKPVQYDSKYKEWFCLECQVSIRTGKTKEERINEDYIVSLTNEFFNIPDKTND